MSSAKYEYLTRCVEVPPAQVPDLLEMIEKGRSVSFVTFAKHTDWKPLARELGYSVGREAGLKLSQDYHVQYFRSRWQDRRCYFMVWSAIEHIFVAPKVEGH